MRIHIVEHDSVSGGVDHGVAMIELHFGSIVVRRLPPIVRILLGPADLTGSKRDMLMGGRADDQARGVDENGPGAASSNVDSASSTLINIEATLKARVRSLSAT